MSLYQILDISVNALPEEIKAAYKRLAMKHHPDRNNDEDGEKFKAIKAAYDVLSDPDRRAHYDKTGDIPVEGPTGPDAITREIMTIFRGLINSCPDLSTHDVAAQAKLQLQEHIINLQGNIEINKKGIARLKAGKDRMTLNGEKSGIFNDILQGQIDKKEDLLLSLTADIDLLADVIEELSHYEYTFEAPPPTPAGRYGQSTHVGQHLNRFFMG
jgi:hypothetical protein